MNTSRDTADDFMQILAKHTKRIGIQCSFGKALPKLTNEMRASIEAALNNDIPAAAIARALGDPKIGLKVTPDSILKHQRQECGCFK